MKNLFGMGLLAVVAASAACASAERIEYRQRPAGETSATVPGVVTDATSFCDALCGRQEQCDNALDAQTCRNTCENGSAAVFPKLRGDVVGLVIDCFAAKDCKSVLTSNVVATCAAEAVASVAPTAAAVTYCDALTAAKKKCGSSAGKAECLDQAKLYGDEAIAEAQNCAVRPCTEIDTCVGAALGALGTSTSVSTTAPPRTKTGICSAALMTGLGACRACAEGACCVEATACMQDAGGCGRALSVCASSPTSPMCLEERELLASASRTLLDRAFSCASTSCGGSCGAN